MPSVFANDGGARTVQVGRTLGGVFSHAGIGQMASVHRVTTANARIQSDMDMKVNALSHVVLERNKTPNLQKEKQDALRAMNTAHKKYLASNLAVDRTEFCRLTAIWQGTESVLKKHKSQLEILLENGRKEAQDENSANYRNTIEKRQNKLNRVSHQRVFDIANYNHRNEIYLTTRLNSTRMNRRKASGNDLPGMHFFSSILFLNKQP